MVGRDTSFQYPWFFGKFFCVFHANFFCYVKIICFFVQTNNGRQYGRYRNLERQSVKQRQVPLHFADDRLRIHNVANMDTMEELAFKEKYNAKSIFLLIPKKHLSLHKTF